MKKTILTVAAVALALMMGACNKSHQCKCEFIDTPDDGLLKVFEMDSSIDCEDITEMSFEEHVATDEGQSLRRVEVHKVKCREYNE
jgi:hypothetical protein